MGARSMNFRGPARDQAELGGASALVGRITGGRYRLERLIGTGGMGVVFEATQLDLQRKVAVKLLDDVEEERGERLRREALTAGRIASPHVVSVFDFQSPRGEPPILVMELLEGESLTELLRRETKLSVERAVRIGSQVLLGLEAAHRAGIVHRDVKPSNVWLQSGSAEEHVKVLDFGIARVLSEGTSTHSGLIGTPSYVAPEQLRGLPADPPADLHAVGILMFEMLSGSLPWRLVGASRLEEILSVSPPLLHELVDGVPRELALVVARALKKDPGERYPSADEMRRALLAFARGESEHVVEAQRQRERPSTGIDDTAEVTIPPFRHARTPEIERPAPPVAAPQPGAALGVRWGRLARGIGTAAVIATVCALCATVLALPGRAPPPRTATPPPPLTPASVPEPPPAPVAQAPVAQAPATSNSDPAASPKQVRLQIRAIPKEASLVLDGRPIDNPYDATVPVDVVEHVVEVTAIGYLPQVRRLRFEEEVRVVVTLRPTPTARRVRHPLDDGDPYR